MAFTAALLLATTAACNGGGPDTKETPAAAADKPADPGPADPAPGGEVFEIPAMAWPPPASAADEIFKKREGAHFENNFENWQVTGHLKDDQGRDMDFTALFAKSGSVYMLVRHGFASLNGPTGRRAVSFGPAILRLAAARELKKLLESDPGNQQIQERIERLESNQSPGYFDLTDAARVLRNSLAINYDPFTLNRVSDQELTYSLKLDIQGELLDLELHADRDPVPFYDPVIPVGASGTFDGMTFPQLAVKGTLTREGNPVQVSGSAMFQHFWGAVEPAAFSRFAIVALNFQNGAFLQTFRFHAPDGALLSESTRMQKPLADPELIADFTLTETDHWTSPLSGVTYPIRWDVSGGGFQGVLALDDTTHELAVAEGRGAFYLGPCSFRGRIPGAAGAVAGRGACRLVAPQP